uniref:neurotrypsin-like n=1 Tax=Styela clava TaxID=7725 RepID=UPI00193A3B24|nr:neurotrypsin-like [Styela clava]
MAGVKIILIILAFHMLVALYFPAVESKRGKKAGPGRGRPQKKGGKSYIYGPVGRGKGPHGGKKRPAPKSPGKSRIQDDFFDSADDWNRQGRSGKFANSKWGYNSYFTDSRNTFHNPYFHIFSSNDDFEWTREFGWHQTSDTEDEYHQSEETTTEASVFTTKSPTTGQSRPAWRSEGSFTGDIKLKCLKKKPKKNCGYGIVQIYHKEMESWGTICGDSWSPNSAKVVCKYLNYRTGKALQLGAKKIPGELKYSAKYLRKLQCRGEEWSLTDCFGEKVKQNYTCKKEKLAAVKCSGYLGPKKDSGSTGVTCKMSEMNCKLGDRCITPTYVCDGMSDCPWGSDEENCNSENCNKDQYWCGPSGGGCISNEFLCDGEPDCIDKSDERECERFLEAFTKTDGRKLRTRKSEVEWTNMNAYMCAQKCKEETEFVCASFDFNKKSQICLLYSPSAPKELKKSKKWVHYKLREIREDCAADHKYRCKDRVCIAYNQVCDSTNDCEGGEDESECEPMKIRLRGGSGPFEGRVEVSKGLQFGLICDTKWTIREANVVCRQLGYSRGASEALNGGSFERSTRGYKLDNVRCIGRESNLEDCRDAGWGETKCRVDHEAGVVCLTDETTTVLTTTPIPASTAATTTPTTIATTTPIVNNCGVKPPESLVEAPQARVVGGSGANPHEWPWQAGIWLPWTYWCGGSLIHPCWVLTAAHCFERKYPLKYYTIRLGDHVTGTDDGTEQEFKIGELFKLEYNSTTKEHDMALIKLESKTGECAQLTDAVQLICVPKSPEQFSEKTICHVTGWGKLSAKSTRTYTPILQEAAVPLISDKKCKRESEYKNLLKKDMMCAGYLSGGIDSCQGDSGGPLSCQDVADGRYYSWGVVSWGNGCAQPKAPGVYAKVGNYLDWISETTGINF